MSVSGTARTLQAAPTGPPLNLTTQVLTSSTIHLAWTTPLIYLQNGVLLTYTINVTRIPGQYGENSTYPAFKIVSFA